MFGRHLSILDVARNTLKCHKFSISAEIKMKKKNWKLIVWNAFQAIVKVENASFWHHIMHSGIYFICKTTAVHINLGKCVIRFLLLNWISVSAHLSNHQDLLLAAPAPIVIVQILSFFHFVLMNLNSMSILLASDWIRID